MDCTEKNTILFSAACYPNDEVFPITRQFSLSARKFGYPLRYVRWRDNYKGWDDAKYASLLEFEKQFRDAGIEYLCWCDAADSICVSPFSEFIEKARTIKLPHNSLLTATDWYTPFSAKYRNNDPVLEQIGLQLSKSPIGYTSAGLIFGHIDAFKKHISNLREIKSHWDNSKETFASLFGVSEFNPITIRALDHNCEQILCHLRQLQDKTSVIADIGQKLLSNYWGDDHAVSLEYMREPKWIDKLNMMIGEACIVHGSLTFKKDKILENFIDTIA